MNISNLKKSLHFLKEAKVTPHIIGKHGIGKSSIVKQFAKEIGYEVIDLRLGQMADPGDIIGLADFVRDALGQAIATKFMRPSFLPTNGKWILFLDEVNRANKDVLQAIFQLVLDRKVHEYEIPEDTFIIAASNPPTGDYAVLDFNDAAFQDRFVHIKLDPTVKEFIEFGKSQEVNPMLLEFFADQPALLESQDLEDFSLDFVKSSRRSVITFDRIEKTGMPQNLLKEVGMGILGTVTSTAYFSFLENNDVRLTGQEVLTAYKKNLKKLQKIASVEQPRMDVINGINDDINKIVQEAKELNKTQADNLMSYIKLIPLDSGFGLLQKIVALPSLMNVMVDGVKNADYIHENDDFCNHFKQAREAIKAFNDKEKASQNTQDAVE